MLWRRGLPGLCRVGIWIWVLPWHGAGVPQHPFSQLSPAVLLFSSCLPKIKHAAIYHPLPMCS